MLLLAGFGMPPMTHTDDEKRAVQAAKLIVKKIKAIGYVATVGVATGQVFCGVVGSLEEDKGKRW